MISICTCIKNRAENLIRLMHSLGRMHTDRNLPFELIIADFKSDDFPVELFTSVFPTKVVQVPSAYFNRSIGLNTAAANAQYEKLFFIDVDMLVPETFLTTIDQNVYNGRCFFPICYSLHKDKQPKIRGNSKDAKKANGWWRKEGCGMAGFTVQDFNTLGRWDVGLGISYGKEDGELYRRSIQLERIRENLPGLFHVWHPTSQTYREQYHKLKRLLGIRKKK